MGGPRLDNAGEALKGSYSGPVITPGDSAGSKFIRVLTRPESAGPVMPLGGERLPPEQIELLAVWIDQRAVWPDAGGQIHKKLEASRHWSFSKPPLEMDRVERNVDRTSTVATVWLGLTAGCARCHDHKFDPITQRDFYSLYGFFNTSIEHNIDAPLPGELDPYLAHGPEYERRRDALFAQYKIQQLQDYWEQNILRAATNPDSGLEPAWKVLWHLLLFEIDGGTEAVETPKGQRTSRQDDLLSDYFIGSVAGGYDIATTKGYEEVDFKELKTAYAALREEFPELTKGYTIIKNPEPPQTPILVRGDYRSPGIPVEPDALSALPPLPPGIADRLALGRWLVSSENPLTAQVAVNRIWQQYFGAGLVSTPEDFGTRGEAPSHAGLLDWLAVEFMENGWDVKALHRLIVTSATYRQSSDIRPAESVRAKLLARRTSWGLRSSRIRSA